MESAPTSVVVIGSGSLARVSLELTADTDLRVLAHHHHLRPPSDPAEEALLWQGREAVPAAAHLSGFRAVSSEESNQITGHQAARLLVELALGGSVDASLPGPLGLPGGYPVRDHEGRGRAPLARRSLRARGGSAVGRAQSEIAERRRP
jgi:hypothetical protein